MEQSATGVFTTLTKSDNPLVAVLAALCLLQMGVIVYQWRHTMTQTVPKWIWDAFVGKMEEGWKVQDRMATILETYFKK